MLWGSAELTTRYESQKATLGFIVKCMSKFSETVLMGATKGRPDSQPIWGFQSQVKCWLKAEPAAVLAMCYLSTFLHSDSARLSILRARDNQDSNSNSGHC